MEISFKDVDAFKTLLIKRGLSQSQLAKLANVTQPYLNQVINGTRKPGIKFCDKICSALNLEFEQVFVIRKEVESINIGDSFHDFPFCFSPNVAKSVGLGEAIIIQFITDWQSNSRSSGVNYLDNHYWLKIKQEQWADVFVFWDKETIAEYIEGLLIRGLVIKDNDLYRVNFDKLKNIVLEQ